MHHAKAQRSALHECIAMLTSGLAAMQSGQRLTCIHTPGAGIQVAVNGTVQGMITGDDVATAFLSIWLGAHPPNAGLKSGLLGGAREVNGAAGIALGLIHPLPAGRWAWRGAGACIAIMGLLFIWRAFS